MYFIIKYDIYQANKAVIPKVVSINLKLFVLVDKIHKVSSLIPLCYSYKKC